MRIILVLGIRLLPSGKLEDKFIASIRRGVELMQTHREIGLSSLLVISGGVTRPSFCSEAKAALDYIPEGLHPDVRLEERAATTRQNVRNVRELLVDIPFDALHVISTPGHVARARELIQAEWPEALSRFHAEPVGTDSFWDKVTEKILGILMNMDRRERVFLPLRKLLIRWRLS
jgi:hypothetical protein